MFKLHYAPNTAAVASVLALDEAGADYELIRIDLKSADQTKPAFLALNPKGRVPLLETEAGLLTETGAILEYVAPALIPDDPFQAARMRETIHYLAATMHVAHAHKLRGNRWADDPASFADMQAKVPQTMADCCAYLEHHLTLAPFALGDRITLADLHLFTVLQWVPGDGVDLAAYPKLQAFGEMMETRPSVQSARSKGVLA